MKPGVFHLICLANETRGPDAFLLSLKKPEVPVDLAPGHFFMIRIPDTQRAFWLPRPFSIYTWWGETWQFLIQRVGAGTHRLSEVRPGETLVLNGPFGNPFPVIPDATKVLLLSGGVGFATLYPLHVHLVSRGMRVYHVYGARTSRRLVEWQRLEDLSGEFALATDDGSNGFHGRLDQWLRANSTLIQSVDAVYQCGPIPMMSACYRVLRDYTDAPVFASMEVTMGCGYGVCRGCAIPVQSDKRYAMACVDGPVFNCDEVDWSCLTRV